MLRLKRLSEHNNKFPNACYTGKMGLFLEEIKPKITGKLEELSEVDGTFNKPKIDWEKKETTDDQQLL